MENNMIDDVIKQVIEDLKKDGSINESCIDCQKNYGVFDNINEAIEAADKAQKQLYNLSIDERDRFADVIRETVLKEENLNLISKMAVEETEIGRVSDKIIKNKVAATKTPGKEDLKTNALTGSNGLMLEEFCPFGVIGSITPTTNPTETIISNSISMIVGGNSVVFSPHPRAKKTSITLIKMLNKALVENGAPDNLITMVKEPSIEATNDMMKHSKIRLLVATGGPGIVKTVLSSGKKAIGAGAGNPPVVVDETADIEKAAKDIVNGASFDNNVPCIAEKEVFVVESQIDNLIYYMKKNGAYLLTSESDIKNLDSTVSQENGKPKTEFVGKNAKFILSKIGIDVSDDIKLIIFKTHRDHHLVTEEMMMPILPIVPVPNVDEAIECAHKAEHGNRHTAIMHSKNIDKLSKMAKLLECTIFVKNAPSYSGIGVGGEGSTTFTIAGPTGEGITSAKSFCRIRRCVIKDSFSIR
ncbi:MAG: aldehyde dehydrogenase EutE [Peptoniphilus grossensis]|uniref:aldehyde dehydrogenase family protein n=1 Tax=Peptoniphilus grossensis TaxID=1465756 RepID=UPI00290944E4|nr:aldehyde dehydrogenase family protein [Peptoniphilus grossensis]MDU5099486.1 aldehyde dehydrogenase EutE [Peptoniphilus grossensis]